MVLNTMKPLHQWKVHHVDVKWEVHHMDVKCGLLNGDLTEYIYMKKLEGFVSNPYLVCRLKKSLYGLKQAPKAWYANIDGFFLSLSFF